FGLGNITTIDSVLVEWPQGKSSILKNIESNQLLTIHEKNSNLSTKTGKKESGTALLIDAVKFGIDYKNKEQEFEDYKLQLLLPQ
ncbi:ASPIC/UnbV domain-containing protein, partial [Aquimarina celericrescens]|nr:ASPIC/UnbV domain-containing protein [Aquimarina celericrescens]